MVNSFLLHGEGPVHAILLNGWFDHKEDWQAVLAHINPEHFTLACMDYRGYGEMQESEGPFTLQQIAEDVLALADFLKWQNFSLIGHSMGGMAIQKTLLIAPDRINKLIGIAPVPASGVPLDPDALALFRNAVHDIKLRQAILEASVESRLPPEWAEERAQASWQQSSATAFGSYLEEWTTRQNFSAELIGLNHKISCIIGNHDAAINQELMQKTFSQWYSNVHLITLEGSGHYPMDETPLALASILEQELSPLS
ncbi:alpha/beta fold hydrolase [Acinetobacter sp. WZC-1]|uniref:alpha/beta fold hydrolase n=1 Tax=Acinetobacter sp. WZC-1 TaxID=3459034 RepID=UPI00403DBCC8